MRPHHNQGTLEQFDLDQGSTVHDARRKTIFLNTPLKDYEYMKIALADIPDDITAKYNLRAIKHNGKVTVEIRKGMYGPPTCRLPFPQATRQALRRLRLCARKIYEHTLEALQQSTHLCTGSWQLWCEVRQSSTCQAPHTSALIFIPGHQQLDQISLRGPAPRMAVWQRPHQRVHNRVNSQDATQVPSPQTNKNGSTPLCSHQTKLRSKGPAQSARRHCKAPHSKRCEAPPASYRITRI